MPVESEQAGRADAEARVDKDGVYFDAGGQVSLY